ncbi:restriction endonuclease subunit S [Komagataeibacter xylinus]|uniref:restriction endonuclease subunit S n=1 Tax=Komagataeibacter xylinus TaxID=28448 RepID=UPI00280AB2E0|nr:restriction endonuclease subunit S [Komagataeibacter xylinus]
MNWPEVALKSVADIQRSGVSPEEIASGTDYLGLEHIASGGEILSRQRVDAGELASTKFSFGPSHLLYGKLRPYLGKIALPDFEGVCSTDILPVFPGPDLDRRYLAYFLRQPQMIEHANKLATGANLPRLSPKALAEFPIPLPPLEEQKRIAGILDQAAELCRLRTRALNKLNTLGQAIFHEMFGDPADNPKGFPRKKLLEIVKIIGGSQPAKKHFLYEDGPGRVRFVQTRDFRTDAYKTYVPEDLAKRPFSEDDVIIGRYGPPVFQIFRGLAGTYNVALMKAQPIGEITKDFVFYLLQEPKLHGYVVANSERTAGQSGVNLDLLEDYPVYAPPVELQADFSKRLTEVDTVTRNARRQSLKAQTLFASLQHRAFRGEL